MFMHYNELARSTLKGHDAADEQAYLQWVPTSKLIRLGGLGDFIHSSLVDHAVWLVGRPLGLWINCRMWLWWGQGIVLNQWPPDWGIGLTERRGWCQGCHD